MSSHPLESIKKDFGDKSKLVSALEAFTKDEGLWLGRMNESKGLAHVSNAKLLKLHRTFTAVKEKFGTRAKMIDAIAELEKRAKDEGYKTRLGAYPVPRLWDLFQASTKRSAAAEAKKAPKGEKKAKPVKVAPAPKKKIVAPPSRKPQAKNKK